MTLNVKMKLYKAEQNLPTLVQNVCYTLTSRFKSRCFWRWGKSIKLGPANISMSVYGTKLKLSLEEVLVSNYRLVTSSVQSRD